MTVFFFFVVVFFELFIHTKMHMAATEEKKTKAPAL